VLADASRTKAAVVRNFINSLIMVQNNLRLYVAGNRAIELSTERLMGYFAELIGDGESLTIYVGRHALIFEDQFIDRSNQLFEAFAGRLFHHGIAAVTFGRTMDVRQVHEFLTLVGRKPAITWEEGGIGTVLQAHQISDITTREMSELDFTMDDEIVEEPGEDLLQGSPLWERFAISIVHGLHLEHLGVAGEDVSPKLLAMAANSLLQSGEGKGEELAKDLSRFLLSLKNEKVRIYRTAALNSLVEFITSLDPAVRMSFFRNVFNLNVEADLSERLLRGMSDQVILDALKNASMEKGYAPPVVLQLLGRLAEERGIVAPTPGAAPVDVAVNEERIAELFRADDFAKYVPEQYQTALLSIMKNSRLPTAITEHLMQQKRSLEQQAVEAHVSEIFVQMLKRPVTAQDLAMIKGNLRETINLYLTIHDYARIRDLIALCRSEHLWSELSAELYDYLSSESFSTPLISDLARIDRERDGAGMSLLLEIGTPLISPLLDRLSTENSRTVRRLYLNVLGRLGKECVPQAVSRLTDSRWFVVRNMLYLLREFGDASILPQVRQCVNHPHPKVSQEAMKTCLFFHDREAVPHLLKMLGSGNESEVLTAVSYAAFTTDAAVISRLVELLHEAGVMSFKEDLKKAAVRSLGAAAPKRAVPVFAEILHSSSLFHGKQLEGVKLEVIAALEKIPGEESQRLLTEQAAGSSAELARAARGVLARIHGVKS
jgi:HEAT repeat protein